MWRVILTPFFILLAGVLAIMVPFFTESLGIGREVVALNNGNCQQIPELQACEDSWLHHDSGLLYLSCASSASNRLKWLPALTLFSSSKYEPPSGDYVAIYDTRSTSLPLSSRITRLKVEGFHGNRGEGQLNLHGINVEVLDSSKSESKLRIFLNNHRPSLDDGLNYLDGNKYGANSTIETFDTFLGSDSMRHVRTYANEKHIRTPNSVTPFDSDSFFFTNDHKEKLGWKRELDFLRPRSDVSFCDLKRCYPSALNLPAANGLVRSIDDERLFFVASSSQAYVRTLKLEDDNSLTVKDLIHIGAPSDNLSVDEAGDVWAAAFPKVLATFAHLKDPHQKLSPTSIMRIRRNKIPGRARWIVEKMFEDDGNVASGITTAAYDVRTHQLFLSGVMSPALTICQLP